MSSAPEGNVSEITLVGELTDTDLSELLGELGPLQHLPDRTAALLAMAEGPPPRLILLTPGPGSVSRVEFLRGLRGLWGKGVPPCVVLVETEQEDLLAHALEAGAADAVQLPYRPSDLRARLKARMRLPGGTPAPRQITSETFSGTPGRSVTQTGGFLFGNSLVLSELGGVGITLVLKALRLKDGTLAALKLLDPEIATQDADWSRRFVREQQLLSGIEHENLVRIRAGGTLAGIPYLDMDFYPGETLDVAIQREGHLSENRAVEIGIQTARGLKELHDRRIVHRDVKPENILIEANSGRVRVCDFGLSKPQDDAGLTHEGEILGTVAFISPEMLGGGTPDARSDIYALGVTLFEMLTGQDILDSGPTSQMFQDCVKGAAQARALERLSGRMRPVVSRMLAVSPEDRFGDAGDLLQDLEAL